MSEAPKVAQESSVEMNKKKLEFIEEVTKNADEIQTRVLAEILHRNANVEYLQRHGLNRHVDRNSFKKIIPVVTYEDILPDINRIALGDTSPILCADPISEFLTSSGTSGGERKMIPTIEEDMERRGMMWSLVMPVISQFVAGLDQGKGMYFLFIKCETKTPGGLLARPVLTSIYKSSHFKNSNSHPYTSPIQSILCLDYYQSIYSQLLCGLCQSSQVLRVGAIFASGFIRVIRFLENHWALLCHDIRTGTLNPLITDTSVRDAVLQILKPDLELAGLVESECGGGRWNGIIPRLWPNTKYIDVIVTGAMSQYIPTLDYYSDGIPLVCTMYASSECCFGVNLNPLCSPSEVSYTFIPTMCYYEFLPVRRNVGAAMDISLNEKEEQELVDLVDVRLGQEYELVVTTYAGLYRYRVGDVVRVAGFKNKAPQFNFVCRNNVLLSIDCDKTDEVQLQNAVRNAATHLTPFDVRLVDYTSYADTATIPGHYVVYWELSRNQMTAMPPSVFEDCCITLENSLDSVYRQNRVYEMIGPLEIKMVENGTFDKLMDYAISLGASFNQYKTPRCVTFAPIVELLDSRVVYRYTSPKCPKWTPGLNQ